MSDTAKLANPAQQMQQGHKQLITLLPIIHVIIINNNKKKLIQTEEEMKKKRRLPQDPDDSTDKRQRQCQNGKWKSQQETQWPTISHLFPLLFPLLLSLSVRVCVCLGILFILMSYYVYIYTMHRQHGNSSKLTQLVLYIYFFCY